MDVQEHNIRRDGNKVYFHDEIDRKTGLILIKELYDAQKEVESFNREHRLNLGVILCINSYGGSTSAAFAVIDYIRRMRVPVYTIVEGVACSAATLIALAGEHRSITKYSTMLIHQHSTWFEGTYQQLKDSKKWDDSLYKSMVKYYSKHTHLSKREVKRRLKHDWFMSATEALRDGFVEEIL